MKIVLVNGSIRKGSTYSALKLIEKTLSELGDYEFEYIHMKDTELDHCKSCFQCFTSDEKNCFQFDKSILQKEKLLQADGIIFSSPIYAMNISGAMKTYIDSLTYLFHRPEFQYKKAMAVTTTMGTAAKSSAKYLRTVLKAFGVNDCSMLPITQFGKTIDESEKLQKQVIDASKNFHVMLSKGPKTPSFKDIFWFNQWKALTQVNSPKDFEYWTEQGWYNSHYYFPVKLSPIKKLIGTLTYKFFNMIMK